MHCIDGPGIDVLMNRCADVYIDFGVGKWDGDVDFSKVGTGEAVDAPEKAIEEGSMS